MFTSRDPLDGVNGTAVVGNAYHYGNNNPLSNLDPTGMTTWDAIKQAESEYWSQVSEVAYGETKAIGKMGQGMLTAADPAKPIKDGLRILQTTRDKGVLAGLDELDRSNDPLRSVYAATRTRFLKIDIGEAQGAGENCFSAEAQAILLAEGARSAVSAGTKAIGSRGAISVAEDTQALSKPNEIGPSGNPGAFTDPIDATAKGIKHTTERHFPGGPKTAGKSIFNASENIQGLVNAAERVAPATQPNTNLVRVVNAGRVVGIDVSTGL